MARGEGHGRLKGAGEVRCERRRGEVRSAGGVDRRGGVGRSGFGDVAAVRDWVRWGRGAVRGELLFNASRAERRPASRERSAAAPGFGSIPGSLGRSCRCVSRGGSRVGRGGGWWSCGAVRLRGETSPLSSSGTVAVVVVAPFTSRRRAFRDRTHSANNARIRHLSRTTASARRLTRHGTTRANRVRVSCFAQVGWTARRGREAEAEGRGFAPFA